MTFLLYYGWGLISGFFLAAAIGSWLERRRWAREGRQLVWRGVIKWS